MDYQRIFILLGLAVTAYLLILAWNNDYNRTPVETDVVTRSATNTDVSTTELPSPAAGMDAVQATDGVQETNIVPELDVVPDLDPVSPTQPAQQIAPDTGRLVQVETDVFSLTIDTLGGDITYVSLPEFPNSLDTPDNPFVLVDPRNSYSAQSGLIGSDGTDNTSGRPLYTTVSHYYNLDDKDQLTVVLTLPDAGDGLVLRKEFEFNRSDYLIRINYTVENQTDKDWSAAIFAQIKRDGQDPFNMDSNLMGMKPYIGGATWTPDTPYQKLEFEDLEEELYKDRFANGYMAMVQHYFVSALYTGRRWREYLSGTKTAWTGYLPARIYDTRVDGTQGGNRFQRSTILYRTERSVSSKGDNQGIGSDHRLRISLVAGSATVLSADFHSGIRHQLGYRHHPADMHCPVAVVSIVGCWIEIKRKDAQSAAADGTTEGKIR